MDYDTYNRIAVDNSFIIDYATPIVVSIPPDFSVLQRSRFLKTSLRKIVKGDFLYIDCDTLICRCLDEIDSVKEDIAMVLDAHLGYFDSFSGNYHRSKRAGFNNLENAPFYNGGVVFSRDCEKAHLFFDAWHNRWLQSVNKGVSEDQPALCQANVDNDYIVKELPGVWNCQLFCFKNTNDLNNAKIFHYFTDKKSKLRELLFEHIREEGVYTEITNKVVQSPLSLGYAIFSMGDKRAISYILSNNLFLFDSVPKLYKFVERVSMRLVKPYRFLSRLKHFFSNH